MSVTTNKYATIEEMLEVVLSIRSVQRLYSEAESYVRAKCVCVCMFGGGTNY